MNLNKIQKQGFQEYFIGVELIEIHDTSKSNKKIIKNSSSY